MGNIYSNIIWTTVGPFSKAFAWIKSSFAWRLKVALETSIYTTSAKWHETMNNNHIMCLQRGLLLHMSKNTKTTYRKTIWKLSLTFHCTNIFSFDLKWDYFPNWVASKCFPPEHQRNEIALINRNWSRRASSRWKLKHKNAPVEVAFGLVSVLFR